MGIRGRAPSAQAHPDYADQQNLVEHHGGRSARGRGRIGLGCRFSRLPQRKLLPMRRAAQIVFQNPDSSLNPRTTVGELLSRPIIRFGLASSADVPARVKALLDTVRLPAHYGDRYAYHWSARGSAPALSGPTRKIVPCLSYFGVDDCFFALHLNGLFCTARSHIPRRYLVNVCDV